MDKRRAQEADKISSARQTAEDSRKAREIARKARQSGASSRADAERKALEKRGIFAEQWKRERFGDEAAAAMVTTIVDSDGRRMREARVDRIVRRAVAVFADGIGGLRSLRYNKARRARGDLTAGISPEVAARLVALARMFVQRRHKERLAALPGPDASGDLIGEGQDPAASFHRTIRKVKTAALLGSALASLRIGKLAGRPAFGAGEAEDSPAATASETGAAGGAASKSLASQSAAPSSKVWASAKSASTAGAGASAAVHGAASSAQRAREEAVRMLAEMEADDDDTDDASTTTGSASSRKEFPIGSTRPMLPMPVSTPPPVSARSESKAPPLSPPVAVDPNPRQGSLAGPPALDPATAARLGAGAVSPGAHGPAAASAADSPLRARRLVQPAAAASPSLEAAASPPAAGEAVTPRQPSSSAAGIEQSPRRGQLSSLRPQQPVSGIGSGSGDSPTSPVRGHDPGGGSVREEREFGHADVALAAQAGERSSNGVGSMGREGAVGATVGADSASEASRLALSTAPRDKASLTPSEAMLLGTPDERRAGFPHDVESLAARRAAAAHRLWVAAHEVANPGVVAAVAAAARGGAEEACRATAETVRFWLRSMLLERYADTLIASGFDTLERLAMMEQEDMGVLFKIAPDLALVEEASLASLSIGSGDGISVPSGRKKRRGRQPMAPGHFKQLLRAVRRIRKYMDEADVEFMMEGAELMPDSD